MERSEDFFAFARERHSIYLKRRAGLPAPWTSDPVLHQFRFTNVFRELDATTVWFRENVRDPLRDSTDVLLATVLFRWFNRVTTGEAIFCQTCSSSREGAHTPWDLRQGAELDEWTDIVHQAIVSYCGKGPYVTGAYIISSADGYDKLNGVLKCVEWFVNGGRDATDGEGPNPHTLAQTLRGGPTLGEGFTLEGAWKVLCKYPYLGEFMAYEIVTDLRHTALLDKAPDIMTWANPGPGAMRGLNRLQGRPLDSRADRGRFIQEMRDLLLESLEYRHWPQFQSAGHYLAGDYESEFLVSKETEDSLAVEWQGGSADDWPRWEMRDIEHTLCEFDKYERARLGEGRPKGVYRHGS